MRPGAAQFSALLGVLHSGAAYVAIDPELPEERRLKLLARCSVRAVITEQDLRDKLAWPQGVSVLTLDEEATRECSAERPARRQGHDDLAYVIFTSGSTGEPKGVMITHRSAANTVQDINRRFGVGADDRTMALAPTGFDLSVYDLFGVLARRRHRRGARPRAPQRPRRTGSQLIGRHGVTMWNSRARADAHAGSTTWRRRVPRSCRAAARAAQRRLDPGGPAGPDPRAAARAAGDQPRRRHRGLDLVDPPPDRDVPPEWSSIPYGKPLANQTMPRVRPVAANRAPVGVTGEIYIGGVGVAQGYLGDPERTAERFVLHPVTGERLYRTGDLGRYLPDGDIEFLGREDFQVKISGYRVELGEIEAALLRQPGVRTALVTAPAHARTGQRQIAAYVVPEPGADPDPAVLREALSALLPGYMVPSRFLALDTLPLTTNGKIDHKALPAPWNETSDTASARVAPRDRVEERLFALWSQQLGHGDFGVEEGFFDIGGDSLHAVGLLAHLRAEFGIGADMEQEMVEGLFMNASIESFAELIANVEESAA